MESLLANYIHQKELLLEAAGCASALNAERMRELMRPRIEKMADLIADWDTTPEIIMSAVFEVARKNRHPDGPMPNMLFSAKYLTKALGEYLQVPYEAVVQKKCMAVYIERVDWEFKKTVADFKKAGITDVVTATSYPIEYRYLMALQNFDMDSANYLAQELLVQMANDRRSAAWLKHRGVLYEKVAAQFNKWKQKNYG